MRLADVVTKLMLRESPTNREPEIKDLPCQLESISVEELFCRSVHSSVQIQISPANVTEYDLYLSNMRSAEN